MSTPLTKAEFDAGLKAFEERLAERLEERLAERIEKLLFLRRINGTLAEFDLISETRDTNPHGYTEEDVPRLVKEVRAEMAAERAARQEQH